MWLREQMSWIGGRKVIQIENVEHLFAFDGVHFNMSTGWTSKHISMDIHWQDNGGKLVVVVEMRSIDWVKFYKSEFIVFEDNSHSLSHCTKVLTTKIAEITKFVIFNHKFPMKWTNLFFYSDSNQSSCPHTLDKWAKAFISNNKP